MLSSKSWKLATAISIGAALALISPPVWALPTLENPTVSLPAGFKNPNLGNDKNGNPILFSIPETFPSLDINGFIITNNDTNTVTLTTLTAKVEFVEGDRTDFLMNGKLQPGGSCKLNGDIDGKKNCTANFSFNLPAEADDPGDAQGGIWLVTLDAIVSKAGFINGENVLKFSVRVHDVPEPSSLGLALTGLVTLGAIGLRRRKRTQSSSGALRTSPV